MRNNFSAFVLAFALVILSCAFGTAWSADENGITLIQPTGGTVSYEIQKFGYGNSAEYYVYLSNKPEDGWRFVRYIVKDESNNDITLSTATEAVTGETVYSFLKQNATVTAEFEEAAHSITVTQPTGGTVTASPTKASEGDKIDLSYTVSDGYLFRRFIVRKTSDNSEVIVNGSQLEGVEAWYFKMPDGAVTVTAEISASHAITVQNPENGSINVHENGNFNARLSSAATGDTVWVTVGASAGYSVKSYAVTKTGDSSVSVNTTVNADGTDVKKIFTFTMPDYPVTVSAQTEIITYPITYNTTNCSVNGPSQGHLGDTLTFTVTPNDGYRVRTIAVNGETTYGISRESVAETSSVYKMTLGDSKGGSYIVNVVCDNESEPGFLITKQFNMGSASIKNSAGDEITRAEGGEQVTIKLLESTGVDYSTCYFYPTGTDYSDPNEIKYANQLTGDNTFTMPFHDMTVLTTGTAKTFNLTVTSEIEHGTVTAVSATSAYKFNVTLTITPDTGYVLTKLVVDGEDVASLVSDNEYTFQMPAHDVSVSEAVFSLPEYTITYDGTDGATFETANPTTYTIESGAITLNNPTRVGYKFAGWTGTELDGATETVTIAKGSTGDRSYTATWTATSYTITYELGGGTLPEGTSNPGTYTIETEAFTLTNPTREHYRFTGWTLEGSGDAPSETITIPQGSTGNLKYIANWEELPYFAYHSLILSGQIGVEFYAHAPYGWDGTKLSAAFTIGGKPYTEQVYDPELEADIEGGHYYGFRCYISSVQMADEIQAVLKYDDDEVDAETYTAKEYLDGLIADTALYSADVIALGKAIKNYGSYVQPVLAKENNWEIGVDHVKMDSVDAYTETDFDTVRTAVADHEIVKDIEGTGVSDVKYTLYLNAETTIEVLLTPESGRSISNVKVNGKDNGAEVDGKYRVQIAGISAHKLGNIYTITGNAGGSKDFTVKVSALSYVQGALNDEKETVEMKRAVTSLYKYCEATMTYRKNRPDEYK